MGVLAIATLFSEWYAREASGHGCMRGDRQEIGWRTRDETWLWYKLEDVRREESEERSGLRVGHGYVSAQAARPMCAGRYDGTRLRGLLSLALDSRHRDAPTWQRVMSRVIAASEA